LHGITATGVFCNSIAAKCGNASGPGAFFLQRPTTMALSAGSAEYDQILPCEHFPATLVFALGNGMGTPEKLASLLQSGNAVRLQTINTNDVRMIWKGYAVETKTILISVATVLKQQWRFRMMIRFLKKGLVVFCLLSALASLVMAQGSGMMGQGAMMGPMTSLHTMPGYQGHELDGNMVVPEFAVGDHYTTSMILFNMGNTAQMPWLTPQALQLTGEIYFYHQDGSPLQVNINGENSVSHYPFTLAASNSISLEMTALGGDFSGWALIKVNDDGTNSWGMMNGQQMMRANRIMATVDYNYKEGGQLISRAGMIPNIYEMQRYLTSLIPAQMQDGINTAMVIVNTSAQDVTVQLSLKNASGETVATRQLMLHAGNQMARFIDEAQLFGGMVTSPFHGFVQIDTSSEGVVAMGMLFTGGIMTSIPTPHHGPVSMF
jgi:hypothetical protein